MSTCKDNPRAGRIGCGATFNGRQQHAVARVDWSTHADGRAHVTFSNENTADLCWRGETMRDPATLVDKHGKPRLRQDDKGIWRYPGERPDSLRGTPGIDEPAA